MFGVLHQHSIFVLLDKLLDSWANWSVRLLGTDNNDYVPSWRRAPQSARTSTKALSSCGLSPRENLRDPRAKQKKNQNLNFDRNVVKRQGGRASASKRGCQSQNEYRSLWEKGTVSPSSSHWLSLALHDNKLSEEMELSAHWHNYGTW